LDWGANDPEWGDGAQQPEPEPEPAPEPPPADARTTVKLITEPQKKKLNVLVGKLREGGHLTTRHLYMAMAGPRKLEVDVMAQVIEGALDEDGTLHWGPLRDTLDRAEAGNLIERLEAMALARGVE
jgi:hypothetical protein